MELLPISDDKIKIMLSREDLAAWQLSCDTIDYDTTETRRAFWGILDEAKKRTGFDAAKEKVFVQLYPAKNGGCEMYVTKLHEKNDPSPITLAKSLPHWEKRLYAFSHLEDMLSACARLAECGFASESAAYAEMHTYYLSLGSTLPKTKKDRRESISLTDLVSEYGKKIDLAKEAWLSEHGECICPDHAVERYAALAASGYRR
ncbi:MAG: adaptor protein MecA [Clostridia bacterium]|nr:adaptor protein MecA [Clostridia bacterium]